MTCVPNQTNVLAKEETFNNYTLDPLRNKLPKPWKIKAQAVKIEVPQPKDKVPMLLGAL